MEMKKYRDISRVNAKNEMSFSVGEPIVCQEKLDGSNASVRYDAETDTLRVFSRRQELSPDNTLQGFYDWVMTNIDKEKFKSVFGTRYIMFGEWVVKHKIQYPDSAYRKFYMFDVYDTEKQAWLPFEEAYGMYTDYGITSPLNFVPILAVQKFKSWEDLTRLIGMTVMDAVPCGEGIVIKSRKPERLVSNATNEVAYLKLISPQFTEVMKNKVKNEKTPEQLAADEANRALAATIITPRRIEKQLFVMIEDGLIPADWDSKDMKTIAKHICSLVYKDCLKEEPETVDKIENFGKVCGSMTMTEVRKMLDSRLTPSI